MTDAATTAALYAAYQGRIFALAYYLTKDRAVAEDVTQEVFVRALTREAPHGASLDWLKRICVNLVRDQARRARVIQWERLEWSDAGEPSRDVPDDRTPERWLLAAEAQQEATAALARCLAPLTPPERRVLLWALAGVPHVRIAARLGCTRQAVKSQVHRARRTAREGRGVWGPK